MVEKAKEAATELLQTRRMDSENDTRVWKKLRDTSLCVYFKEMTFYNKLSDPKINFMRYYYIVLFSILCYHYNSAPFRNIRFIQECGILRINHNVKEYINNTVRTFWQFVQGEINSGWNSSASEVLRSGIRLLEIEESKI